MAAQTALEDYIKDVPAEKLDQLCTDDHLLELSQSLSQWVVVSPYLGLTEVEAEEIERRPYQRQRVDALRKWKAKLGKKATYRCLTK